MLQKIKWWWQRRIQGFDDRELWSLDITLANYIVPRLQAFRDVNVDRVVCPGTLEAAFLSDSEEELIDGIKETDTTEMLNDHWRNVLNTMIEGFTIIADEQILVNWGDKENTGKANRALCLFHKYYFDLWD